MALRYRRAFIASWLLVCGCSSNMRVDDMDGVDAGRGMDSGPGVDAGRSEPDSGPAPERDAGLVADAGPRVDAHVPASDAGPDVDPDAGPTAPGDAGPGAICMVDGDCAETGFCDRRYS